MTLTREGRREAHAPLAKLLEELLLEVAVGLIDVDHAVPLPSQVEYVEENLRRLLVVEELESYAAICHKTSRPRSVPWICAFFSKKGTEIKQVQEAQ